MGHRVHGHLSGEGGRAVWALGLVVGLDPVAVRPGNDI